MLIYVHAKAPKFTVAEIYSFVQVECVYAHLSTCVCVIWSLRTSAYVFHLHSWYKKNLFCSLSLSQKKHRAWKILQNIWVQTAHKSVLFKWPKWQQINYAQCMHISLIAGYTSCKHSRADDYWRHYKGIEQNALLQSCHAGRFHTHYCLKEKKVCLTEYALVVYFSSYLHII